MTDIKFGTDGWRAVIADQFTFENVRRLSQGASLWMLEKGFNKVVIGYDTRFNGIQFTKQAASVFACNGITVIMDKKVVTTPMISLATNKLKAGLGVVITASHNPPEYNGYKLKSGFGGPSLEKDIKAVENLIPLSVEKDIKSFEDYVKEGLIIYHDIEKIYFDQINDYFDLELLRKNSLDLAYDSMYGAGQFFMKTLLPEAIHVHDEQNPGFKGQAPEPIERNLKELADLIKSRDDIKLGLANDGDADRIGLFNSKGEFVDSHHIMLLVIYYLVEYKKYSGKIVVSVASSEKIVKLASLYGLEVEFTKIGFKNIAPIILKEKVLLGGEEAGGISAFGHIPERDGIWIGLLILELISVSGKSLEELVEIIYSKVGSFTYNRYDLKLPEEKKRSIIAMCERNEFKELGGRKINKVYSLDGYKFYLEEDVWVMIRPSGTEPVLRLYAQARNKKSLTQMMDEVKEYLLGL